MSFNEAVSKWETEKLSLLTDYISRGITPKYTDDNNRSILVVNQRCIREGKVLFDDARRHDIEKKKVSEEKFLRDFDVLVNSTGVGTLGRVSQIKKVHEPTTVDSHVTIVRGNGEYIDKKYLGYAIKAQQSIIENMAEGSTGQTELSRKRLGDEIVIGFPKNKQEQTAIAHILSTLDDKIEVNNEINKTLENMAQAIFKQWFVDFEFPNEDGEPYKSSGGEMVESELGLIPKGWVVEEIGNISDIQNGFAFKAPEYVDEGVKVLRTLNIGDDGYFNNTDIVFLPRSYKSEKYEKYYFEEFDVALVMVGASIGKIGMILKNTAGGLQNQNMWRFRRKEKRVSQIYIYYTVKQAQNISKNWSTGSARDFYRKDSFRKIKVILPEKRIMDLFEKITKPIFQIISNNVCENDELISMRDTLLPKLMSGEIRVPLDKEGAAS